MAKLVNSYPIWLRAWHSVNGILCLILITTGIMMQYSSPIKIETSFPIIIYLHNGCGILLIISWIFFIITNGLTKNGIYYWPNINLFKESFTQFRYYAYGMFKGEHSPFKEDPIRKFNPLQQLAYFFTMYLFAPLLVITGFIMLNIERLLIDEKNIFVYQICDLIHISAAFMISVFLVIHLYLVYIEGLDNLKKIIFKKKFYHISGK